MSIHNEEENEFVQSVIPPTKNGIIGLKRNAGDSDFNWSDQSEVNYVKWLSDSYPHRRVKINPNIHLSYIL